MSLTCSDIFRISDHGPPRYDCLPGNGVDTCSYARPFALSTTSRHLHVILQAFDALPYLLFLALLTFFTRSLEIYVCLSVFRGAAKKRSDALLNIVT